MLTAAGSLPLQREKVNKMPVNEYFGGHGEEVMAQMRGKHGSKEGKRIFYATANKKKQRPEDNRKKTMGERMMER